MCIGVTAGLGAAACAAGGMIIAAGIAADGYYLRDMSGGEAVVTLVLGVLGAGGPAVIQGLARAGGSKLTTLEIRITNGITSGPGLATSGGTAYGEWGGG